jgi:hypothetical protein
MTTKTARSIGYWTATLLVAGELGLGGAWDLLRVPEVTRVTDHLGYPRYLLVILGVWKVAGAVALLVPGLARVKEWAYAGAFFTYSGAIASHLTVGYAVGEIWILAPLTALTVASWYLRPATRRS